MRAYGHKDYSFGAQGDLCVRTGRGDWESSDTLALVDAYLDDLKVNALQDTPDARRGYFDARHDFGNPAYDDVDFSEFNKHLDAIVPGWLADA